MVKIGDIVRVKNPLYYRENRICDIMRVLPIPAERQRSDGIQFTIHEMEQYPVADNPNRLYLVVSYFNSHSPKTPAASRYLVLLYGEVYYAMENWRLECVAPA